MSAEAGDRYAGWTYIAAACVWAGVLIISASSRASAGTVSLLAVIGLPLFGLAALWERSRGREYQVTERDRQWMRRLNWLFVVTSVASWVLSWLFSR
jgi:hypothetical protein